MNIKDFLELRKSNLTRETLTVLFFSFLFSLITFSLLKWFFAWLGSDSWISHFITMTITGYKNVFLIALIAWLFLVGYFLGLLLYKKEFYSPFEIFKEEEINFVKLKYDEISKMFDWQGYIGNKYLNQGCLLLSNSSEGLLTKKVYKNYELSFEAKILLHGFGLVLCAKNLENYFMLRIGADEKGLYVSPHIRKDGIWEVQQLEDETNNKIVIELGSILKFKAMVKGRVVELTISGKNEQAIKSNKIL
ncbi:hypothetical protein A2291_00440 [candidate division WOR-1 bacterium RIFOXYB2_FULL_42_35]|uniref:Uncharacterized protein n=1 Tax=candidate division WOR-1 bacterium RIFOXYC2_FULL_41_25 TaxID=1802586 RepID=A0A1F4TNV9_UNCSA|nr:MAG: hypothetical protein A2291_00440 [candidate division WOR-1 bacterium RIFOXYB2_FULL_42_35]OGC34401.1 MAG: hypothetical protein A2462_00875 [candidate division WOR-1 bacterium RIFOXYC2_FULL_41_25]